MNFNGHLLKLNSSIRINPELLSNVTISNRLQSSKHPSHRISTERGMQIDFNEHSWKHFTGIRLSCEPISNATSFRLLHDKKHNRPMMETDRGMQIDCSPEYAKQDLLTSCS
jgi:hypothetical protein